MLFAVPECVHREVRINLQLVQELGEHALQVLRANSKQVFKVASRILPVETDHPIDVAMNGLYRWQLRACRFGTGQDALQARAVVCHIADSVVRFLRHATAGFRQHHAWSMLRRQTDPPGR